jgi:type VI secretion system protein ImpL
LLGSAQDKLEREDNAGFLKNQLLWLLDENYFRRLHPQQAKAVRKYAQDQTHYFVDGLAKGYWKSFENSQNQALVQRVCASMQHAPTARGLYQRLIYGTRHLPSLNLNTLFAGRYGDILQSAAEILGVYTQKGKSQFDAEVARALNGGATQDWVCGGSGQTSNTGIDREAMRKELDNMYLSDYAVAWWRFLESIQCANFDDLFVAIERLEILADPRNSPLVQLFQRVAEEMKFPSAIGNRAQNLLNQGAQAFGDSGRATAPLNIAEQQFADLIQFAAGPQGNGAAGGLTEVLGAFDAIRGKLEAIQNDPFKAKEYAAKALKNEADDFPSAMRMIGQSTNFMTPRSKNVARRLLEPPVAQAWTAILGNAQQYLNEQWKNVVHREFHSTLAEYYPFNKDGMDAPTADVEKFFQPERGTLWQFYNDALLPFLRKENWRPISWEDYGGIGFSRTVLTDFQRANAMAEELFRSGALQLQFSLEPKLPAAQGGLPPSQVCITIDGQPDCYRMGPPSPIDFTWPRGEGNTSLQIITQNGALEIIKKMQGQWGVFHLLEKATIVPRSSSMFDVSWEHSAGGYYVKVGYTLRAKSAYNPFKSLQKNYFDFKIPAQLN